MWVRDLKFGSKIASVVRAEPSVISLMNYHNDKAFMRTTLCTCSAAHSHNLIATVSEGSFCTEALSWTIPAAAAPGCCRALQEQAPELKTGRLFSMVLVFLYRQVSTRIRTWMKYRKKGKAICLKCQNVAKAWTGRVWVDFGDQATGCCYWQIEKRKSASGKGDLGLR